MSDLHSEAIWPMLGICIGLWSLSIGMLISRPLGFWLGISGVLILAFSFIPFRIRRRIVITRHRLWLSTRKFPLPVWIPAGIVSLRQLTAVICAVDDIPNEAQLILRFANRSDVILYRGYARADLLEIRDAITESRSDMMVLDRIEDGPPPGGLRYRHTETGFRVVFPRDGGGLVAAIVLAPMLAIGSYFLFPRLPWLFAHAWQAALILSLFVLGAFWFWAACLRRWLNPDVLDLEGTSFRHVTMTRLGRSTRTWPTGARLEITRIDTEDSHEQTLTIQHDNKTQSYLPKIDQNAMRWLVGRAARHLAPIPPEPQPGS